MFTLDDRHWPLAIIAVKGLLRGEEFERYLRSYDVLLARAAEEKGKYVLIFDALAGKTLELPEMRLHAEWIKNNVERLQTYNLGVAFMISSAIVRGALKAILWLQPMPQPYTIVSTFDEALRWVEMRAQAGGIQLPDSVQELAYEHTLRKAGMGGLIS